MQTYRVLWSRGLCWHCAVICVVLMVHCFLLVRVMLTCSPTVDEVSHLPSGLSHWRFGRFDLYRVNPPLVQGIAAMPLLLADVREDWNGYAPEFRQDKNERLEFSVGRAFVAANGAAAIPLYRRSRLACVPFSIAGALSCYFFARDLYGRVGGIVSLCMWCFSPFLIGNAAIVTPDAPGAAMAILAVYASWRWLSQPDATRTILAGLALGLAQLAKTTCAILYFVIPVIWLIRQSRVGRETAGDRHKVGQLLLILLLGIYVTNLGYLFDGSFQRLGDFPFVSRALGGPTARLYAPDNPFRDTILGWVPVPFPADYIHGIDLQRLDFEGERWSYAAGVQQLGGWWWWYLYALAVKTPHGTMVLVLMAVVASWTMSRDTAAVKITTASRGCQPPDCSTSSGIDARVEFGESDGITSSDGIRGMTSPARLRARLNHVRGDWLVLIPAAMILVLVSSQTGFSRYLRYLLPAYPFVFVWVGRVGQSAIMQRKWWATAVIGALGWNIWSCLCIHPHHMAYFNELSGGPDNGHWHLLDANVDWGQASLELKRWLDEYRKTEAVEERTDVYLSLFAEQFCMKPSDMGIDGQTLPLRAESDFDMKRPAPLDELPAGLYAISVNHLHGYRHARWGDPDCSEFLNLRPIAVIGHAIHIFRLPLEP